MKVNVYFLIVGILSILFCFTHAWNGFTAVLPLIDGANFEIITKTTFFYVWHIISIENLVFGVAFIIMAFYKDAAKVKFTAWIIAIIIIARWGVILGSTLFKDINDIWNTLTDSIAIVVFVGLTLSGIRKINKTAAGA